MKPSKISVRVYGIYINENKILALLENYENEEFIKLPGGGLEYGEGVLQCLHRELKEELDIKIKNYQHFYTQEDFIISKFDKEIQILTIYYLIDIEEKNEIIPLNTSIKKVEWIDLDSETNPFLLPVDKLIFEKLKQEKIIKTL